MLGAVLIISCTILWATDAIFRLPLAQALDAATIIFLEHVICVVATFPLFYLKRKEVRALGARGWLAIAFVGVMGSALGTYFFTASYKFINPSVTILLQKLQPIFAVMGARLVLREKPHRSFYAWAVVALLASAMVSLPELWTLEEARNFFPSLRVQNEARDKGIAFALSAAFVWGLGTVFGKWITARVSFPVTSFLRFAFGLLGIIALLLSGLFVTSVPLGNLYVYFHSDAQALQAILYMGLVPGVLAMYLYYAGLKQTKASVATFAELFFPVASIAVNWSVLGQALVAVQLAGMALLLAAVFFINRGLK